MSGSHPAALPPTSLLICSRDRPRLLRETIESVLRGLETPTELIVVDQSARQDSPLAELTTPRACELRYLWSQTTGLSRGRNIAIAAARHDIVAIIDDDMFVEEAWFGALVRALIGAGPDAVVTGRVLPSEAEMPGGFVPALVRSDQPAVHRGLLDRDVLAGGHMAAWRAMLVEFGGFDERLGAGSVFPAADDNDFGLRLLEAGRQIVYAPEAVVYHRAWRPGREYLPMRWNYGRGKGGFYAKHLGRPDGYMTRRLRRDITRRLIGLPRRLWRDPRGGVGDLVYIAGIARGLTMWRRLHRDVGER